MAYLPFLEGMKDNEQSVRQSFNDISNLSRLLDLINGEHNNYQRQLDFFRIIYLVYESVIATNEKLQNEKQLTNRFKNRYGRVPASDLTSIIVIRLLNYGFINNSSNGFTVSNTGIRMFSGLFSFVTSMYTYHQKEDSVEKIIFLTELAGLEFKLHQEMDIDNGTEFIHLVHSLRTLTSEVKDNLAEYVNQRNALDKIRKLQELIERTIKIIREYVETEKITEKVDDFRLKIYNIDDIIQDATLVSIKGLGEVIKAIEASTSQVVYSAIPPELFYNNLVMQIKEAFLKPDTEMQSAYDLALSMDSKEPVIFSPNKIFGGVSSQDILKVIDMADNNEDFGFSVKRERVEFDVDIDSGKPNFLTIEEIRSIESTNSVISRDTYDKTFGLIYEKAIEHADEERTIYDWIFTICHKEEEQYFFATVFVDFIHFLNKLTLLNIEVSENISSMRKPEGWSFVKISGYSLLTGDEQLKFPPKDVLKEYDYSSYKRIKVMLEYK